MRVRMTEDATGSVDGVNPTDFEEGKTYDLPPILASTFVKTGRAVDVGRSPADPNGADTAEVEAEGEAEVDDAATVDEAPADEAAVTKEQTTPNSPYYQFRDPDGDLITETEDGEEKVVKVLGQENAEETRERLNDRYASDADA